MTQYGFLNLNYHLVLFLAQLAIPLVILAPSPDSCRNEDRNWPPAGTWRCRNYKSGWRLASFFFSNYAFKRGPSLGTEQFRN